MTRTYHSYFYIVLLLLISYLYYLLLLLLRDPSRFPGTSIRAFSSPLVRYCFMYRGRPSTGPSAAGSSRRRGRQAQGPQARASPRWSRWPTRPRRALMPADGYGWRDV